MELTDSMEAMWVVQYMPGSCPQGPEGDRAYFTTRDIADAISTGDLDEWDDTGGYLVSPSNFSGDCLGALLPRFQYPALAHWGCHRDSMYQNDLDQFSIEIFEDQLYQMNSVEGYDPNDNRDAWFYLNDSGSEQGPHTGAEILAWLRRGILSADRLGRHVSSSPSDPRPLHSFHCYLCIFCQQ